MLSMMLVDFVALAPPPPPPPPGSADFTLSLTLPKPPLSAPPTGLSPWAAALAPSLPAVPTTPPPSATLVRESVRSLSLPVTLSLAFSPRAFRPSWAALLRLSSGSSSINDFRPPDFWLSLSSAIATALLNRYVATGRSRSTSWWWTSWRVPSWRPTSSPVPSSRPTSSPVPSSQPTSSPVPSSQPTSSPVPSSQPTSSPVPSSQPTSSPVPSSQPTSSPVPSSHGRLLRRARGARLPTGGLLGGS